MTDIKSASTAAKKRHVHEIDLIRSITVFSVFLVHALPYTRGLGESQQAIDFINLVSHSFHYNREMFMFVTAFVLTYVYFGKPFPLKKFWLKRFLFILIPYTLWSLFYIKFRFPFLQGLDYWKFSWDKILIGGASYQLYYILLTIQFYALFPIFLFLLKKLRHKPWYIIIPSFLLQLGFMYFDFVYLQHGTLLSELPQFAQTLYKYQDRNLFTYQFYFILGCFAAVYMEPAQAFIMKHGKTILYTFIGFYLLYAGYYYLQIAQHEPRATAVLQPSVVIYSTLCMVFFPWFSTIWARNKRFYGFIHLMSEASFGIYLVHVFILSLMSKYYLPNFPGDWPIFLEIISFVFLTYFFSFLFTVLLLKNPMLSWTVGKVYPVNWSALHQKISFHMKTKLFRKPAGENQVPLP